VELVALDGEALFDGGVELVEDRAGALERGFFAFEADPSVACGGADAEAGLEFAEEFRVAAVEGLGDAGVLVFEREVVHQGSAVYL
jgi:hypothetical protein